MSGTDGIDAAHREPHQDVGCGFDILQARHGSFQLSLRNDPGFPIAVSPMSRVPRLPMRRILIRVAGCFDRQRDRVDSGSTTR